MRLKHTVQLLIHTLSDAYEHLCARTVVLYRDYMDRKLKNEYIYTTCENYEKVVGLSVRVGVCVGGSVRGRATAAGETLWGRLPCNPTLTVRLAPLREPSLTALNCYLWQNLSVLHHTAGGSSDAL